MYIALNTEVLLFSTAILCIIVGVLILTATQDLPDGNYAALKGKGKFSCQGRKGFMLAMRNYRLVLVVV